MTRLTLTTSLVRHVSRDPLADARAERRVLGFDCPQDHHFDLTFAAGASPPTTWDCPRCGKIASRSDGTAALIRDERPSVTAWDRLLERRTYEELDTMLAQHLTELRASPQD